jgi:Flp pilus assembly protein TadG
MSKFKIERRRSRRPHDEGAAAVEAAFTLLWLVLLIFGVTQFGTAFWQLQTMLLALEEAGRYAMVYNAGPPANYCDAVTKTLANCVVDRASNILAGYAVSGVSFSTTTDTTTTPHTMTIQGTYTFNFIPSDLLPYGPITVSRDITVPLT